MRITDCSRMNGWVAQYRSIAIGLLAHSLWLSITTTGFAQKLYWLGTLGGNESVAYGVSDNGIVVGMARDAQGQRRAFRWQCNRPMVDLGTLGGPESIAYDISADGRVIVGAARISDSLSTWQAFKYQSGVMTNLGSLVPLGWSEARGVSADGSVIVGWSNASCPGFRFDTTVNNCVPTTFILTAACQWTSSGITQIGNCTRDTCPFCNDCGFTTAAYGVSKEGTVWVGGLQRWDHSHASGNYRKALKNNTELGSGVAYATTQNGGMVVGQADAQCFHPNWGYYRCRPAYRWPGGALSRTDASNPDDPRPSDAIVFSVTASGHIAVGTQNNVAVRWRITGPSPSDVHQENLNVVYASLVGNSVLQVAYDISSNGRYIVGVGYNAATRRNEAFLLDTWQACPICPPYTVLLSDRDLQRGVLRFDTDRDSFSVFGACQPSGTRYYYGIDVHPHTGEVWACDLVARRIVRLSPTGVCLQTIPMPPGYTGMPTGLAIHPSGRYLHVTNQGNRIDAYDIQTGRWVATTLVSNVTSLYGLKWVSESALYVCDFGGKRLLLLTGDPAQPLAEMGRVSTPYNPYDVTGYTRTGGRAPIDYVYITQTQGFYGNYAEVSFVSHAWDTPGTIFGPYPLATHPGNNNADGGGPVSFFGIEIDPARCQLWVSDYVRGDLYSVNLASNTVTFRGSIDAGYKLGLGVAILPRCIAHNGDVDGNGCVNDSDLLAVLFVFGQSGSSLGRADINCDERVDDADLLTVLFNFGRGC